jgi:hypothetical protein
MSLEKNGRKEEGKFSKEIFSTKSTSEERPHILLCSSSSIAFALSGSDFTYQTKDDALNLKK